MKLRRSAGRLLFRKKTPRFQNDVKLESSEVEMAALTIKNIPEELYQSLKESAKRNHRSLNSEVIACMEKALNSKRFDPKQFLAEARKMRKQLEARGVYITEEFLRDAKKSGRK